MPLQTFDIILKDCVTLTSSVKHFIFNIADDSPFAYIPGQFIRLHLTDECGAAKIRSYSLATTDNPTKTIEFAASYIAKGLASECLFTLKPGDRLKASGPYGKLVFMPSELHYARHIFVATGTGTTPYLTMLKAIQSALKKQEIEKAIILQGVQTRQDLLYADAFNAFSASHPNAEFIPCYSRENSGDLKTHERAGYVQEQFPSLSLNPATDKVYLCGNPAMIDDAFAHLKECGFDNKQIVREKYISPK